MTKKLKFSPDLGEHMRHGMPIDLEISDTIPSRPKTQSWWIHALTRDYADPFLLNPKKATTLGRHRSNDIILKSAKVSRYHAQIRWNGSLPEIVDLGSNNGVLVNGVRVQSQPLKDGDEISISNFQVVYRRVRNFDELETIDDFDSEAMSTAGNMQMFSGQLAHTSIFQTLSRLATEGVSGHLKLVPNLGEITVLNGQPIAARYKDLTAEPALLKMLTVTSGTYVFFPEEVFESELNIHTDFSDLVAQLAECQLKGFNVSQLND